ncbi:MAG: hypothetical protein P4L51_13695 [Puia sp.]|nr:hypothetical protein [Puia sp.]
MQKQLDVKALPTGKILFKLTMLGCFLLGASYACLMLLNSALQAIK